GRIEIGGVGIGLVVGLRVLLEPQQLITDDELVAPVEFGGTLNTNEHAVPFVEVLDEQTSLFPQQQRFTSVREAFTTQGDETFAANRRHLRGRAIPFGATVQATGNG